MVFLQTFQLFLIGIFLALILPGVLELVLFWICKALPLPEHYRTYADITFFSKDFTVYPNSNDRPWIAQHLTDEQWRRHRYSFKLYSHGAGKYKNFRGGMIGWLKCEGLPPITPEMQAELEEHDRAYETQLIDAGMTNELEQWRARNRERQAAIEAIEVPHPL